MSLLITVPAPVQEAAIMEASRENVLEGEGVMKVPSPVQAAIVEARRENVRILFPASARSPAHAVTTLHDCKVTESPTPLGFVLAASKEVAA